MAALIVIVFALGAIVLIEAGYWIAISLARWAPVIAVGATVGWLAHRCGVEPLDVLGLAILACLAARHVLRSWRSRKG
jgi:hypothetical protein